MSQPQLHTISPRHCPSGSTEPFKPAGHHGLTITVAPHGVTSSVSRSTPTSERARKHNTVHARDATGRHYLAIVDTLNSEIRALIRQCAIVGQAVNAVNAARSAASIAERALFHDNAPPHFNVAYAHTGSVMGSVAAVAEELHTERWRRVEDVARRWAQSCTGDGSKEPEGSAPNAFPTLPSLSAVSAATFLDVTLCAAASTIRELTSDVSGKAFMASPTIVLPPSQFTVPSADGIFIREPRAPIHNTGARAAAAVADPSLRCVADPATCPSAAQGEKHHYRDPSTVTQDEPETKPAKSNPEPQPQKKALARGTETPLVTPGTSPIMTPTRESDHPRRRLSQTTLTAAVSAIPQCLALSNRLSCDADCVAYSRVTAEPHCLTACNNKNAKGSRIQRLKSLGLDVSGCRLDEGTPQQRSGAIPS